MARAISGILSRGPRPEGPPSWGQPTCVGLHVLVEVLLHVEVLATPLAHELLVADVDAHVRPKLVLVLEAFVAVLRVGSE